MTWTVGRLHGIIILCTSNASHNNLNISSNLYENARKVIFFEMKVKCCYLKKITQDIPMDNIRKIIVDPIGPNHLEFNPVSVTLSD